MKIICEVFLSKHTGSDIAQIVNASSQLMHPLLVALACDIKIVIKVCYECLTDSDHSVYTCCKRILVKISLNLIDHLGNQNVPAERHHLLIGHPELRNQTYTVDISIRTCYTCLSDVAFPQIHII